MKNLIIRFDEDKVSVKESERHNRTVWYDITPIVKSHVGEKSSSVMEYVVKIEAEVCDLYDDEDDYILRAREEFEDIINAEYRRLGIFQESDGLNIKNDARRIRLTFANGSTMDVQNSEWGSITLS